MFTSLDENVDGQDKITFGDNSKGKVQGLGNVAISNDLLISNVLLVAPLRLNLLLVGQLCDLGLQCLFTPTEVIVSKMDDESKNGLLIINNKNSLGLSAFSKCKY